MQAQLTQRIAAIVEESARKAGAVVVQPTHDDSKPYKGKLITCIVPEVGMGVLGYDGDYEPWNTSSVTAISPGKGKTLRVETRNSFYDVTVVDAPEMACRAMCHAKSVRLTRYSKTAFVMGVRRIKGGQFEITQRDEDGHEWVVFA